MDIRDAIRLAARAVTAQRLRSFLTLLGIAVGIASVILLTSIGEGIHRYVLGEFTQFGTNVVTIAPGKTKTGGAPSGLPSSARPLTLEDAQALGRLPNVVAVTPNVRGNAEVQGNGRTRRTLISGVNADSATVFRLTARSGQYLPDDDAGSARAFVVLGAKLKDELFGPDNALGQRIRIGGLQFRVIGIMEAKGQFLGIDLDDTAFIPAARAQELFNREGVDEINVAVAEGAPSAAVASQIRRHLIERHGREDFTIVTQEEMLKTLSNILNVLTMAVGALGGISLLVGGVGIVTIMTIAVTERTSEIGLLVALGARRRTILGLFLGEAIALSAIGGALGLLLGFGLAQLIHLLVPALPVHTPISFVLLAEGVAIAIGLAAGVLPARRAAGLDPVEALRSE
ncbi:peptide ABC transporter permease [Azonexus hydrophilus]|uniref:Peptide ABC transporter permease n=1 Tax=Azonexus hydrophilus TaxID=418702 RepID=A0A1R1ID28_9RHOO|nr:ABC transporter permease [Azonexus hydrophilus]OMG56676.1 peptide ABC transporter permease [Azonexus hydrophilus]